VRAVKIEGIVQDLMNIRCRYPRRTENFHFVPNNGKIQMPEVPTRYNAVPYGLATKSTTRIKRVHQDLMGVNDRYPRQTENFRPDQNNENIKHNHRRK